MNGNGTASRAPWAGLLWRLVAYAQSFAVYALLAVVAAGAVMFGLRGSILTPTTAWIVIGACVGAAVVFGTVQVWLLGRFGATLSQRVVGYRVVDVGTLRPVGFLRAAGRQVTLWGLSALTAGLFTVATCVAVRRDPRRRGWHDRWFSTVAVWPGALGDASAAMAPLADRVAAYVGAPGPPPEPVEEPATLTLLVTNTPPPPPPPPTPAEPEARVWILTFDDDRTVDIDRRRVLGRDPRADAGEDAAPTVLSDPDRTISKTHAALWADARGTLWIEDRDSTHGVIVRRGREERRLTPRTAERLTSGDVLVLGLREATVHRAD